MNMSIAQVFFIVAAVLFGCAGVGVPYGNLVAWGWFFFTLAVILGGYHL